MIKLKRKTKMCLLFNHLGAGETFSITDGKEVFMKIDQPPFLPNAIRLSDGELFQLSSGEKVERITVELVEV